MAELNSYLGLAENRYLFAKYAMESCERLGNYNCIATVCAESAAEYFRSIIEWTEMDEDERVIGIIFSGDLEGLHKRVTRDFTINTTAEDCEKLNDFSYCASWPGIYFTELSREDAEECLRIVESIAADAVSTVSKIKEKLKNMESMNQ